MNSALRGSTARAVAVATVVVAIAALLLGVMANALGSEASTTPEAVPSAAAPAGAETAPPGGAAPSSVAGGSASSAPPSGRPTSPGGAPSSAPQRYIVAKGDTLATIADRSGVPLELIAQDNGLTDANRLSVGQELALSDPPSNVAVIVPGSTLSDYASRLSTTVDELLTLNPQIRDADVVVAGTGLRIAPG